VSHEVLPAWLQVPIYDFKQSRRVGHVTLPVPESRVVVIEGIYALSDRLRPLLDLRVSIAGVLQG
jgi:uridine kinase